MELMFDYGRFEKDLFFYIKMYIEKWGTEKKDIYAFSINCNDEAIGIVLNANTDSYFQQTIDQYGTDDTYYYYKFCEEEWELWSDYEDEESLAMASYMEEYCKQLDAAYSQDQRELYEEKYEEHKEKIQQSCINVLKKIRESDVYSMISGAYLNFYIRESFDEEEVVRIFKEINGEEIFPDFIEHAEDFSI